MRKYVLGVVVGVIFLAYSSILRNQHSSPILPPASLSQNSTSSAGSSTVNSSTPSSSSAAPDASSGSITTTPNPQYKDGTYTGSVANAYYGNVQVSATITNGKITAVDFLQAPDENPNSIYVNQQADPYLKQEAIQAQNSNVQIVTGATFTSQAFMQSLSDALSQAKS